MFEIKEDKYVKQMMTTCGTSLESAVPGTFQERLQPLKKVLVACADAILSVGNALLCLGCLFVVVQTNEVPALFPECGSEN